MTSQGKISRRQFNQKAGRYLGTIGIASTASAFLWSCTESEEVAAPTTPATSDKAAEPTAPTGTPPAAGEIKMVDPSAGAAAALNYCPDATSPTPLCPVRAEAENSTEFCSNCLFFQLASVKTTDGSAFTNADTQRTSVAAECQLLPGQGYVAGLGWCRSWAPRQS